jgi:hypothetical protein
MSSEGYIKASAKKAQTVLKEHVLFDNIQIVIKDKFQEDIDLTNVLKTIEKRVPQALLRELDIIYIGDFPQLKARNVESAFMNGAIFLSNLIVDDDTLLKSIIHEVAHNVEVVYGADVYGDHQLIDEFIGKRKRLRDSLEEEELFCDPRLYIQFDYSKTFDDFLYKTVGYDRLALLTTNLYISPYAATSLREYFANGFEHYFVDENPKYLKSISPKLFNKINYLTKMED